MRLLALDVGSKRIGLALSDPLGLSARPLDTINREGSLSALKEICRQNQVQKIIVGIPYSDPERPEEEQAWSKNALAIKEFAEKVSSKTGIETILIDESYSSKEAEEKVFKGKDRKLKTSERHARVDQLSAAIILERYLQEEAG